MTATMKPDSGPESLLGARIPPPKGDYKWVYLWGLPIRAMHWIAAAAITLLVVSGLYIGWPFFHGSDPSGLIMTRFRQVHFLAAVALATAAVVRIYWLVAGNRFERIRALFPLRGRDFANLFRMIKFYMMIQPEKAPHYLGHNPLQQLNYTLTYVLALVEVITGFVMYGQAWPTGNIYALTNWMLPVFGGIQNVRLVHHSLTWWFLIFVLTHVYFAFRSDVVEGGGTVSSIVTGGRYFRANRHYEDEHG
ncbi:MAG: Ni/Fe-hydrogenase, b-type cytochrome subunit [Gemmatimonadales bacterium]|nr:Ni/Fe-hydrogenase, b-type cytochrome subunit [Gemmatimonadales bacterium]